MYPLRVTVLGCGIIARDHLEAMKEIEGVELAAAVDIEESRARKMAEDFGAKRYLTSVSEAVQDEDTDAVIVCLPHSLHAEAVIEAARYKKHILTEKPMAISLEEADQMIAAAEANGVTLMVGQVLRFREINRKAKDLLKEGAIGAPKHMMRRRVGFMTEYTPWAADPKMAGGWVLYGFGSHEVDMMLWLFDAQAVRVAAEGRQTNPHWQDRDDISLIMALDNEMIGALSLSINTKKSAWDTLVIGTEGSMYIAHDRIQLDDRVIEVPMEPGGGMLSQLQEFVMAVRESREPEASGRNVRRTMAALEAAKISMSEGRMAEVSRDPGTYP